MTRTWTLADADWNHWPDGRSDTWILGGARGRGVEAIEVGVYDPAVELSRDRVGSLLGGGVAALLVSMPQERWPSGGVGGPERDRLIELVAASAQMTHLIGGTTLGLWPGADLPGTSWSDLCAGLAASRDAAALFEVRIAVEYKPGTAVADADAARRLAADVPGTGVLLDTGHAWANGEDPAQVVCDLGELLWHVHLGDAQPGGDDDDLPLGRVHSAAALVAALQGWRGIATFDLYGAVAGGVCTGAAAVAESVAHLAEVGA